MTALAFIAGIATGLVLAWAVSAVQLVGLDRALQDRRRCETAILTLGRYLWMRLAADEKAEAGDLAGLMCAVGDEIARRAVLLEVAGLAIRIRSAGGSESAPGGADPSTTTDPTCR